MKDVEKIGYTELDGEQYSYFFNEDTFTLTLIPPTIDKRVENYFDVFKNWGTNEPKNEWIKSKLLHSQSCSDESEIIFSVVDNASSLNGIPQYLVKWYLKVPEGCDYNASITFPMGFGVPDHLSPA